RQLSTFGPVPQFGLNSVQPFDFREVLSRYHTPLSARLKRSVASVLLLLGFTTMFPDSSSFIPWLLRNCFTSFLRKASRSLSGRPAILCRLSSLEIRDNGTSS